MTPGVWFGYLITVGYVAAVIVVLLRLLRKRRKVGVTLAWIAVIFAVPIVGIVAYLIFGELELGRYRARRAKRLVKRYRQWLDSLDASWQLQPDRLKPTSANIARLITGREHMPIVSGCEIELHDDPKEVFDALVSDIDQANTSIWLEFYILDEAGEVERVLAALERASARGVDVFLALDSAGSRSFFNSERERELRAKGVKVLELLPVLPLRLWLERQDLRVHRKIVVIDSRIAWTGSMNLVDPEHFNIDAGVGQWVDSMIRITGPAAVLLKSIVLNDWQVETGRNLFPRLRDIEVLPAEGSTVCQLAPSGPASPDDSVEEILLAAIYGAKTRVRLTTPYFVPGDALVTAIKTAAHRGVKVSLIVPKKSDSKLVALASSSYYEELIEAGVEISIYDSGLLHSKVVLIDDELALFGSVNLDMRSFWLNFELTVAIYDSGTVARLHTLVDRYQAQSTVLNLARWKNRSAGTRLLQQLAYLASPLL